LPPSNSFRRGGLAADPGVVGSDFGLQRGPVGLGQGGLAGAQERCDGGTGKGGDSCAPGGVQASVERKRPVWFDPGDRETGDLLGFDGEVSGCQRQILFLFPIEGWLRPGIKRGQTAARKEVVHLDLDGLDGSRSCCRRVHPERGHGLVRLGLGNPTRKRSRLGEEIGELDLVHPPFAAAVRYRTQDRDDVFDRFLGGVVTGGVGRHHAIAVELGVREDLRLIREVGDGYGAGIALAQVGQDASGARQDALILDGGQRNRIATLDEAGRVLEGGARPVYRRQQLGRADPTVLVRIDEIGGPGLEFDPARGHGQCHPQLLVETLEVGNVRPVAKDDLVDASGAEELPAVFPLGRRGR
jgi:hypothetical protein